MKPSARCTSFPNNLNCISFPELVIDNNNPTQPHAILRSPICIGNIPPHVRISMVPNRPIRLNSLIPVGLRTFIHLTERGGILSYRADNVDATVDETNGRRDVLCREVLQLEIPPLDIQHHRFGIYGSRLPPLFHSHASKRTKRQAGYGLYNAVVGLG